MAAQRLPSYPPQTNASDNSASSSSLSSLSPRTFQRFLIFGITVAILITLVLIFFIPRLRFSIGLFGAAAGLVAIRHFYFRVPNMNSPVLIGRAARALLSGGGGGGTKVVSKPKSS